MNLSVAQPSSRDTLVADCAQLLVDAFADYNAEFRLVTRRAPQRFEDGGFGANGVGLMAFSIEYVTHQHDEPLLCATCSVRSRSP